MKKYRILGKAGVLLSALVVSGEVEAQDRLTGLSAISAGALYENVKFGDNGLLQASVSGGDSIRITGASQLTFPVSAAFPIGQSWTLDITSVYAIGEVKYNSTGGGSGGVADLSGLSDVRIRASGRFFDDALIFTVGANAPTGRTELDTLELTALRVLAAPALGLGTTPVGSGASGTVGLLTARQIGEWGMALGVSYEYRGTYQPVSALSAGTPSSDFQPGGVTRVSLGLDRLVGKHRLSLAAAADLYQADVLSGGSAGNTLAEVQLGPVLSGDIQLQLGVPNLRDLILWSSMRYRTNYSRDGITVDSSSGMYLDGGVRSAIPVGISTDFVLAADGRYHSGLAIDAALPTSGVKSAGLTAGVSQRFGGLVFQPFVRGTIGQVQARGPARESQKAGITGFSGGLVIITRF